MVRSTVQGGAYILSWIRLRPGTAVARRTVRSPDDRIGNGSAPFVVGIRSGLLGAGLWAAVVLPTAVTDGWRAAAVHAWQE